MAITETYGDMLVSSCHTLVCPTNCVGVMGAGLARTIREVYPEVFRDYRRLYLEGELQIDRLFVLTVDDHRDILIFPTKTHWRYPSKLSWIATNLAWLAHHYDELGITSLAIPPVGCGHGGLDFHQQVKPLVYQHLGKLEIPIELYLPET